MNKLEILKGNKLIAEFMGHNVIYDGITYHFYYIVPIFVNGVLSSSANTQKVIVINNLYNTSWDWLIPVVQKINCEASESEFNYRFKELIIKTFDIEQLHSEVVKYLTEKKSKI